jgi:hypothetical protein
MVRGRAAVRGPGVGAAGGTIPGAVRVWVHAHAYACGCACASACATVCVYEWCESSGPGATTVQPAQRQSATARAAPPLRRPPAPGSTLVQACRRGVRGRAPFLRSDNPCSPSPSHSRTLGCWAFCPQVATAPPSAAQPQLLLLDVVELSLPQVGRGCGVQGRDRLYRPREPPRTEATAWPGGKAWTHACVWAELLVFRSC